jgi:hypothetical protein
MTNLTRSLVLSLMIIAASTLGGYIIGSFLIIWEHSAGLPAATIYAPLASLIANVITSSVVSDPKASQALGSFREFLAIQSVIFVIIVYIGARLVFAPKNPKSAFNGFLFSFFVVISGMVIREISVPIFQHYPIPGYYLTLFTAQKTVLNGLQALLSIPFYFLLFLGGTAILSEGEPAKTPNRASQAS